MTWQVEYSDRFPTIAIFVSGQLHCLADLLHRHQTWINENFLKYGFGLWAIEVIGVADFIGFTGLAVPQFDTHFTPCVEIAWRLARDYWGFGFATEAACAARDYGFSQLNLAQIVSFSVPANQRSRNVMTRIGMTHSPDDNFEHPLLPDGHPLRHHVLYRLTRPVG